MTTRVAFFGSDCLYSDTVLNALLASRVRVCAVVLPASGLSGAGTDEPIQALLPEDTAVAASDPHSLSVISPFVNRSIMHTAWDHGVPLYAVNRLKAPETAGNLRMMGADVACVACFPRRIPPVLLSVPRRGFLNVHPSMLPNYRGPAPIFWQFHEGETNPGVTVHWMDAEFDTGPIAAQRGVYLPDGTSEPDATALMARTGARLVVEVLDHVAAGEIPYRKQPVGGSSQPWPNEEDFRMSIDWSARRIFNFIRGALVWGIPYRIDVAGEELVLSDAIAYSAYAALPAPIVREGEDVIFQCTPGTVRAREA